MWEWKETKTNLLPIYRKALTAVSKIKPTKAEISLDIKFNNDHLNFSILVFPRENGLFNNHTINFYEFEDEQKITNKLKNAIEAIKKEDWKAFKELSYLH